MTVAGPNVSTLEITPAIGTSKIVGYDGSNYGHFDYQKIADTYYPQNLLINPNFITYQRRYPTLHATYANVVDGTFGPDRWYQKIDATGVQQRLIAGFADAGGHVIQLFNNNASARSIVMMQVVPSYMMRGVKNRTLRAQLTAACSTTVTLNQRVFSWSGTADSTSIKSIVSSFSSGTPTFATTNYTSLLNATASSTTSFVRYGGQTITVPTGDNNLLYVFWANLPASATLQLTGMGLHPGQQNLAIYPQHNDFSLCEKFCAAWPTPSPTTIVAHGVATANNAGLIFLDAHEALFKYPSIGYSALADWSVVNMAAGGTTVVNSLSIHPNSAFVTAPITMSFGVATTPFSTGQPLVLVGNGSSSLLYMDAEI